MGISCSSNQTPPSLTIHAIFTRLDKYETSQKIIYRRLSSRLLCSYVLSQTPLIYYSASWIYFFSTSDFIFDSVICIRPNLQYEGFPKQSSEGLVYRHRVDPTMISSVEQSNLILTFTHLQRHSEPAVMSP